MKIIGLTGGIGSGKSTTVKLLAELGAVVLDLDKLGHEVLNEDSEARDKVVDEFGSGILDNDGNIDRARLGEIVFKDNKALLRLNRIIHPAIDKIVNARVEQYRQQGIKFLVLEAAVILEAGRGLQVDEIWVTTAPEATVLKRISERGDLTEQEARARIRSQLSNDERIKHADIVIDTDCTLEELKSKVTAEWNNLQARSV